MSTVFDRLDVLPIPIAEKEKLVMKRAKTSFVSAILLFNFPTLSDEDLIKLHSKEINLTFKMSFHIN